MEMYRTKNRYTSADKVLKMKNLNSVSDCQPPVTNRGVQNPKENTSVQTIKFDDLCRVDYNGMLASIDWLDFTVFDMDYIFVIQKILGLELTDFEDTGRGGGGYPNMTQANFGDVRVLHGAKNPEVMGVHVTIPGAGCRALFSRILPSVLIENILSYNCKVTRIDLALDNIGDIYFYPNELDDFVNGHLVKSRWTSFQLVQDKNMHTAVIKGDTVYLGSRASDLFCRVYDKTLERIAKDDVEVPDHWVRWELVCKKDRAQVVCEQLLNTGFAIGEIMFGVLSNYFTIIEPNYSDEKHKYRADVNPRWQRFLGDVKPIRLFRILRKEQTLEDKKDHVMKQYGPTLSALFRVYGPDSIVAEIGLNAWRTNKKLEFLTIQAAHQFEFERKEIISHFN